MSNSNLKRRTARLEEGKQSSIIVVIHGAEESVTVNGVKMTLDEFYRRFPGGTVIRVVRVHKREPSEDL